MDRKSVSAAAFVVAGSLFYPRSASRVTRETGNSPISSTSTSSSSQFVTPSLDGPWKPICDHILLKPGKSASLQRSSIDIKAEDRQNGNSAKIHSESAQADETRPLSEQYCLVPEPRDLTFRAMIVLVPDPELTHLSLDFDRTIESIIWAVDDERYDFESYWFPWQIPADKAETDPEKRDALREDRTDRLNKPGMLLFRRDNSHLMAVFLVGDRPAFGPSRVQFQAAIDGIHTLYKVAKGCLLERIPIIGPSFSGSIQPLSRLIINSAPDSFFVISGRVTNKSEIDKFSDGANRLPLCLTVENDKTELDAFTAHLKKNWGLKDPSGVAILNEGATAYGKITDYSRGFVELRYPRGISRLRNTVDELPGLNTQSSRNTTGYQPLPLILKEPGDDTTRSFSEQLTPVSSEAEIFNLALSLRRKQIRYAGILATDPLDALFLARFLRASLPDVRLFLLESDLLFAREAHDWDLEGVVAITNYPLVLENQNTTVAPGGNAFASSYEEATYNACRRAISGFSPPSGCDAVNSFYLRNRLIEYESPFGPAAGRPALWLTVLGHDGFWPVALLDGDSSTTTLLRGPESLEPFKPFDPGPRPFLWLSLLLILLAIDTTHLVLVGFNLPGVRDLPFFMAILRYDTIRNFHIRPHGPFAGRQAGHVAIMLIALALTNTVFFIPAITFHWLVGWICGAFAVLCVAGAMWMTWEARSGENPWATWVLDGCAWTFAAISAMYLFDIWRPSGSSHSAFFFVYRSVHIYNGVSPAAPMLVLAAGFYYWGWIQTRRFRIADELKPQVPAVVTEPAGFMGEIEGVFGKKGALIFALITGTFLLLFFPYPHIHTVEGRHYDNLVSTALVVLYAMLIGSLVRFSVLWHDLRTLLQFLERHPLREAFSRLPHTFSWISIWQNDLKPTYLTITRSRDCLRRLMPGLAGVVNNNVEYLEAAQANQIYQFQPGYFLCWSSMGFIFALSGAFIEQALTPQWYEGQSESIVEAEKKQLDPERSEPPGKQTDSLLWFQEEFLALQYVALIRYVFFQMRNFLEFVTAGFIIMVIAIYIYPFEDHHLLSAATITLFALLTIGMLVVFAQMDRDPILSRLSATKPRLDMNFVWRVVSYGSLPLLAFLASQFPSIGNFLFSWVQPALQSVK